MLVIKGFLILDNENREYSAYSGSGELCPARGPNGSFKSLTLSLSHSLQCVSLLASRAALGRAGRGSHKLLPAAGSDSLTGPAAVFSEPCRHAATCRCSLPGDKR